MATARRLAPRADVFGGFAIMGALATLYAVVLSIIQGGEVDVVGATSALAVVFAFAFAWGFRRLKSLAGAFGGALATVIAAIYLWQTGGAVDVALVSGALTTITATVACILIPSLGEYFVNAQGVNSAYFGAQGIGSGGGVGRDSVSSGPDL